MVMAVTMMVKMLMVVMTMTVMMVIESELRL